jgi:hypothetical protein
MNIIFKVIDLFNIVNVFITYISLLVTPRSIQN